MKDYKYQIGTGDAPDIMNVAHSETITASSLDDAIRRAREISRTAAAGQDANVVRLLEEHDGEVRIVWYEAAGQLRNG